MTPIGLSGGKNPHMWMYLSYRRGRGIGGYRKGQGHSCLSWIQDAVVPQAGRGLPHAHIGQERVFEFGFGRGNFFLGRIVELGQDAVLSHQSPFDGSSWVAETAPFTAAGCASSWKMCKQNLCPPVGQSRNTGSVSAGKTEKANICISHLRLARLS